MNSVDTVLRRNFILALVLHGAVIGGAFLWEFLGPSFPTSRTVAVELVVPDILGDLPKGPGVGRGAYTPPPPAPANPLPASMPAGAPPQPSPMAADESPAPVTPARTAVTPTKLAPNEMGVPRRTTTSPAKTAVAPTKTKTPTATKTGTTGSATTGTGRDSATEIARRLRNAVASAGGTQYGDGTTAGGGSGRSSRIGSPLGAENGMIGGVNGPGSANWPYYMHVRERMYEAWGQPGGVSDRGLVAVVQIRVARDGSILDATLKRSSGNRAMDLSALEAARKVKLLEPPPSALVQGSAAEISIDFKMEG